MVVASLKTNYFDTAGDETKRKINELIVDACGSVLRDAQILCPVDTGNLEHSIHMNVEDGYGEVGTAVVYAPFVEFGTYKMAPKPFLFPALEGNKELIRQALENIMEGK